MQLGEGLEGGKPRGSWEATKEAWYVRRVGMQGDMRGI